MPSEPVGAGRKSERVLDDLARALAEPMPRRQAVRVLAGVLVSAAVPLARPGLARALPLRQRRASGCAPNLRQCPGTSGKDIACCGPEDACCKGGRDSAGILRVACCNPTSTCCIDGIHPFCCGPGTKCKLVNRGGSPAHACVSLCPQGTQECGEKCCEEGFSCRDAKHSLCCAPNWDPCINEKGATGSSRCCPPNARCCVNSTRSSCCLEGETCCNGRCCGPGQVCKKGVCLCGKGKEPCGKGACCSKGETCCGGKDCCGAGETCCGGSCCPKGHHCCPNGKQAFCCPEGKYCMNVSEVPVPAPLLSDLCAYCDPPYKKCGNFCCAPGLTCKSGKCIG